ncbi:atp-binding cassette sub-family b [Holotrichia oblita]|nr:atp-binding cassette sub-family b [Holotrichia oblita]
MLKLLKYLKQYKKQTILGPIFKLIEAGLELCIPLLMAYLIDNGIKNSDTSLVLILSSVMAAVAITGFICSLTCQYYAAVAGQGFGTNLRNAVFKKVNSLSYSQLDALPPSAIVTRMTSDINQIQLGIAMFIRLATRIPFLLIFGLGLAMAINFKLSLILLGAIPVFALVVYFITRKTVPQYKKVQARLDAIGKTVKENLAGQRVIRAFNKEEEELENSLKINKAYAKESLKSGKFSSLFGPLTLLIINFCIVLILWFGGIQVNAGTMTDGEVIAFINYDCAENEINDISFKIFDRQTIGIIGPTGSGKTTLINLLQGFYKATSGEILIYGINVDSIPEAELRVLFGLVPQKSILFAGTIKENIRVGKPDATDEEIIKASEIAQADRFISSKENGYDSTVNIGGSNFSGGQRQRLTIARALVKNPHILILDDAGSALDYATELRLRKALKRTCRIAPLLIFPKEFFLLKLPT